MLTEIQAGFAGAKAALDVAKGIYSLKSQTEINQAVIEIQRHVLEAQAGLAAAQEANLIANKRIAELEEQLNGRLDWLAEKRRYQAKDIYRGSIVYVLKPEFENEEPAYWLCPSCFNQGHKSYLQFRGQDKKPGGGNGSESTYGCDRCKASLKVYYNVKPARSEPSVTVL